MPANPVLPPGSADLLERLKIALPEPFWGEWRLAGGTGLALQFEHRVSMDFDFFRTTPLSIAALHTDLARAGEYETQLETAGSLSLLMGGVKLSFFVVTDPFLNAPIPWTFLRLATVRDIALMKLLAIAGRGSRKDFVDLYTILHRLPDSLQDYFSRLPLKYGPGRANSYNILRSLTYFDDAEAEPMPVINQPLDWEECKRFLIRAARDVVLA